MKELTLSNATFRQIRLAAKLFNLHWNFAG